MIGWIYWNPERVCFYIPFTSYPVVWYGVLFALGFLIAHAVLSRVFYREMVTKRSFFSEKKKIAVHIDRFTGILTAGLVFGARIGYVFFYGWPLYREAPGEIFKLWHGGLSSHGASAGLLAALFYFVRKYSKNLLSFVGYLDILALSAGVMAFFIRWGNFVNQEIVGRPGSVPWAVLFAAPADGSLPIPRHPVQLYEAFFYLALFGVLYGLWSKNKLSIGRGMVAGSFLTAVFTFRFFIEFYKEPQGLVIPTYAGLLTGQYLSLPFIFAGAVLIYRALFKKEEPQYTKSRF